MSYPNFPNKFAFPSVVNPERLLKYSKDNNHFPEGTAPESVIIAYQSKLLSHVLKNHKTNKAGGMFGKVNLLEETNNKVAIVGGFGIGAPGAVTLLEELIAYGVKKFITIGSAGTLQKDLVIGDLVLCEKSIRDEGCSHHYLESEKYAYPSKKLFEKMKAELVQNKINFKVGPSWTIDTPYRETAEEIQSYQNEGVLCVEMESAALFAVAKVRKVELISLFAISDSLASLEWHPEFFSDKTKTGLETLFKASLSAL